MASMLVGAALQAAVTAGEGQELPASPLVFGLGAFAAFILLLVVTWSFRNISHRR